MAPDEDENNYSEINFPLKKRGLGGFEFLEKNRIQKYLSLAKVRNQYNGNLFEIVFSG